MTTPQSNRERMGDSVMNVLNENAPVYQSSPTFINHVDQHRDNLADVRNWKNKQAEGIEIKGMTRDKNALRGLMVIDALVIIAAIKALATDTENEELWASVDYSETKLRKSKETIFIADCTQVKNIATENAAALVNYGVMAQMITNFGADIMAFQTIMTKSRTKRVDVSTFTKNLGTSVRKMMTHLRKALDNSIKQWSSVAPDFVLSYKSARIVIDYGNTSTGIRGTVKDQQTGRKLKNMIVEIVELQMLTSTNERGVYTFKRVDFGKYTLRIRGEGYITTEIPNVQLEDGTLKDFDIEIMHQPMPETVIV